MSKKYRMVKILVVLILAFSIGINSVSSGVLFAKQQEAQEQTSEPAGENERQTEIEEALANQEEAEEQVQTGTMDAAINGYAEDESAVITVGTTNWTSSANEFIISPVVSVPAGKTGNTITIHLPRYIALSAAIDSGGELIRAEVSGGADEETGTTIVLTFNDNTTDGRVVMGKDIKVSQERYIEESFDATYSIRTIYANQQDSPIEHDLKLSPSINANKKITSYLDIGKIVPFVDMGYKITFTTGFKLNEITSKGYMLIRKDSQILKYYDWTGESSFKQADGSIKIPITNDLYIPNGKSINYSLPIRLKDSERQSFWKMKVNPVFDVELHFDNGKSAKMNSAASNIYLRDSEDTIKFGFSALTDQIFRGESYGWYDFSEQNFYVDDKRYRIDTTAPGAGAEKKIFQDEMAKIEKGTDAYKLEFELPANLKWKGDAADYNEKNGKVSFIPNKEMIDVFISTSGEVAVRIRNLPIGYDYDFDGKNETPNEFVIKNYKLIYQPSDATTAIVLDEHSEKIVQIAPVEADVHHTGLSTVFDTTENVELMKFSIGKTQQFSNMKLKVLPKFSFEVDFEQKKQGMFSINDVYDTKEILVGLPKDDNDIDIPMDIKILTNSDTITKQLTSQDSTVSIAEGQVIQSIHLQPTDNKIIIKTAGTLIFKGDVNVKDKDAFFKDGKSRKFTYTDVTSEKMLTEKETSNFYDKKRSDYEKSRTIRMVETTSISGVFNSNLTFVPKNTGFIEGYLLHPGEEYQSDNAVWKLAPSFIQDDKLRINAIKTGSDRVFITITYTTNMNATEKTRTLSSLYLEKGEYFTSLSIGVNYDKKVYLNLVNNFSPADDVVIDSMNLFEYEKNGLVEHSVQTLDNITFASKIKMTTDIFMIYSNQDLGELGPNKVVSLPIEMEYYGESNSSGVAFDRNIKLYNPIFYLEIPEEFHYEGLELTGSMLNKKPRTVLIESYNGKKLVKVEFYGDGDSETGYYDRYTSKDMKLKLRVDEFAKAGLKLKKEIPNTGIDLSSTLEKLNKESKDLKYIDSYASSKTITIFDSEKQSSIKVKAYKSSSYIRYDLLQNLTLKSSLKVNSSSHIEETDDLSIRSGEDFNVHFKFYNNASSAIEDFTMYIPVAREGKADHDGEIWEWNAKLIQAGLDTTGTVNISYSTNEAPTTNKLNGTDDPSGMYVGNVDDMSKVTMVKLSARNINESTLISLNGIVSNLDAKETMGEKAIKIRGLYSYKLVGSNIYESTKTNQVTVRLTDTSLKGVLFVDVNENGVMESNESRLVGKKVTLYDKEDKEIESVLSNSLGEYRFTVPSIKEGDYLKVDKTDGHVLTWQKKEGEDQRYVSYFDQASNTAIPTLKNAGYLNAGFIKASEIILNPESYTVRMGYTGTIQYRLSDGSKKDIKFESADESIATVDENGVIMPVAEGTTTIKVYYISNSGITVASNATVNVESNNAPVITAPDTVTMNVNDVWNPLDTSIIDGLSLVDDHDQVDFKNLNVEDNIPVGGKVLFFFRNSSTDRIEKAGTYRLKYSYTDKDGNTAEKTVKVKVNGQPYLSDLNDNKLTADTMPDFFFRVGDSLDPYRDVKAFYEKASDVIGEDAKPVEILKDDRTNGIFTLGEPVDNEGNPVAGSPSKAGKYKGTYYIKTASEAKSIAEISLSRTLYAQGKIEFSGHNIIFPTSSGVHKFDAWEDFYKQYKDKLNLSAKLSTPKQDGSIIENDILDTLKIFDPNTDKELDFSTLDFSLAEGEDSKLLMLTLRVYDSGKAEWDSNGTSVYGEAHKEIDVMITLQEYAGSAPHIHADDIHRVSTDEVRDRNSSYPEKNLISKEAMEEAKANKKNPLYERLMNDVLFEPGEDGVEINEKELISIKRSSMNAAGTSQKEYAPNDIDDLYKMMTTIGTYKLMYRTKDSKNNQIFKERILYVTGPTVFVNNMIDMQTPATEINLVQDDEAYIPENVFSYHIDSDEQYLHWTTALPNRRSISISEPGTYEIIYSTEHHYTEYPDGTTPRPLDTFKVTVKVHGTPQFHIEDNQIESLFIDEKAILSDVTASFKQAVEKVNDVPIQTDAPVSNNQNKSELTSSSAATIEVEFTADASTISKVADHKATLKRIYQFYGLPEITAPSQIRVRADITQEELKDALAATASIAMPDGSRKNLEITYDFTNMKDENPSVNLKAMYTLVNGEHRSVEKSVALVKVDQPTIEAQDIVYNVGDTLDILKDSNVNGEYDGNPIDHNDIQFNAAHIPVDIDGNVNVPATYKVTLSYEDASTGNKAEKDILVKVNGLPEFHDLPDLEKRVGDDIDILQKAYVTWLKAPDYEGAAVSESFNYGDAASTGAKFELRDTINEITGDPVDFSALNQPGYYSGEYYAVSPTGGEASERHTLLLHGKPILMSSSSLTISMNVEEPTDFLATYRNDLKLQASVERAYNDRDIETIDLSKEITIAEEELKKISYGIEGSYPIKVSVTDTVQVLDSKHNTVDKTITVNIVDVHGTPPTITTPASVQRVVKDAIGIDNVGESNIAEYLLNKATYTEVKGNEITTKKLISIRKVQGPQDNTFTQKDAPDDELLKQLLNTVGEYEAIIEVIDEKLNRVQASMKIEVAGQTEFGYDHDGEFVKIEDVVNVRQSDRGYSYDGLYARHMDPSGDFDKVGIIKSGDVDISTVSRKELTIAAPHHYPYYDDDIHHPRGNDELEFYLLVQGRIELTAVEDIRTRLGTQVDSVQGIEGSYETIDKDGHIEKKVPVLSSENRSYDRVGQYSLTIKAEDVTTGAPENVVTVNRNVIVWSIPNISYNEQFNAGKNATLNDLKNGLQAQITYTNDRGENRFVTEDDIDINYEEVLNSILNGEVGKRYPITISVQYKDQNMEKSIQKTAYVYVLNDPSTIIQIPKYLELRDDGTNQVTARADVSLYQDEDKDESKESVPSVDILIDTEVKLSNGNASFMAYSYWKDSIRYDGTSPIMTLQYGKLESDHFFLKANKEDMEAGNIGLYKGTLNFTMEYGGE